MIIFHDPRCTDYYRSGDPERPTRIAKTVPVLQERHASWEWRAPEAATDKMLRRAHTAEHIDSIKTAAADFDADTPAHPHIHEHAARAAGSAVEAAMAAIGGQRAFSLMRPPGHHATRTRAMGFCYYSNIAVAALEAIATKVERVAIWDFDAHHGNGTENIVADNPRFAFASVHQFPGYPGTGTKSFGNITNFPVAPLSARTKHVAAAEQSLQTLLQFDPDLLLVSAGFDAYSGDPITEMTLEIDDFATFGRWLREIDLPVAAVLEGGYSGELPELIDAFLSAW
ncbi:MAG TPA: histone deacetylase [Chthoniobacterales bacterium]|nr:histone deacetylase [Chthoniobacterales bacterium]